MGNKSCRMIGLVAFVTVIVAADSRAVEVDSFGVKGGVAYSQVDMYAYRGSDWNADLTGGAFVQVAFSAAASVEASAVYVRRRGGYYDRSSHPDGALAWVNEAQVELDYIDFSLLARYRIPCRHAFSPVLIAGPSWGELLSSEYEQNDWRDTDWIGRSDWD